MTLQLRDAIGNAKTLSKLSLIAQQLDPCISYWGRQYMVARNSSQTSYYVGSVPVGALVDRALEIIQQPGFPRSSYSTELAKEAQAFDNQIERIYCQDEKNCKNCGIITTIALIIRSICIRIWYCMSHPENLGHQYKWAGFGDDTSFVGLGRHILEPQNIRTAAK